MAKERTNISFDPAVYELLNRLENRSQYVNALVQRRWRDWQEAFSLLVLGAKWRPREIAAVCDVCNGLLITSGIALGVQIAASMEDGQQLDGVAAKWDVSPQRWGKLTKAAESDEIARALWLMVEEFWSGNTVLQNKLEL